MSEPLTTQEIREALHRVYHEGVDRFDAWHDAEVARIEARLLDEVVAYLNYRRHPLPASLIREKFRTPEQVTVSPAEDRRDHDAILRDIADTLATLADRITEAVGDD